MGSTAIADRRDPSAPRRPFNAAVDLKTGADHDPWRADAVDLSVGGMCVQSGKLPSVGEQIGCRFTLEDGQKVTATAEVVWSGDTGRRPGAFGVRFASLPAELRGAMRGGARARDNARVSLTIEETDGPFRARLRERVPGALIVTNDLSFFTLGRRVRVDGQQGDRHDGVINAVDIEVDPKSQVPRLILTVDLDEPKAAPAQVEARAEIVPPAAEPEAVVTAAPAAAALAELATASTVLAEPIRDEAPKAEPIRDEAPKAEPAVKAAKAEPVRDTAAESDGGKDDVDRAVAAATQRREPVAASPLATDSLDDGATDEEEDEGEPPPSWLAQSMTALRDFGAKARDASRPALARAQEGFAAARDAVRARVGATAAGDDESETSSRKGLRPQHATRSDLDGPTGSLRRNRKAMVIGGVAVALAGGIVAVAFSGDPPAAPPRPQVAVTDTPTVPESAPAPEATAAPELPEGEGPTEDLPEPRVVAARGQLPPDLAGAATSPAAQVEGTSPVIARGRARVVRAAAPAPAITPRAAAPARATASPAARAITFGSPSVRVGATLTLRMDGPITSIGGPGTRGNSITITLPGRRSLDPAGPFARRDARLLGARVANRPAGAELTLQCGGAAPPFAARARGSTLEVVLANAPAAPRAALRARR